MKIAVLMKSVPDTATPLRIGEDRISVVIDELKPVTNPYDEYALEEAVKLKETAGGEVIVVCLGDETSTKTIRTALAAGADRALHINSPPPGAMSAGWTASVLAAALGTVAPDLILAGKQAVDDDAAQVPERVAEILRLPHASGISRLALSNGRAEVDREIEGGFCTMELPLPALFSVTKGINTPRYPTLPNIMKAKQKEIRATTPAELGCDAAAAGLMVEALIQPRQQRLLKILAGDIRAQVSDLVPVLREATAT